jgi:hypothetical protein
MGVAVGPGDGVGDRGVGGRVVRVGGGAGVVLPRPWNAVIMKPESRARITITPTINRSRTRR